MGRLWAQQEVDPLVKRPGNLRITHCIITNMLHILYASTSHIYISDKQHVNVWTKNTMTMSDVYILVC